HRIRATAGLLGEGPHAGTSVRDHPEGVVREASYGHEGGVAVCHVAGKRITGADGHATRPLGKIATGIPVTHLGVEAVLGYGEGALLNECVAAAAIFPRGREEAADHEERDHDNHHYSKHEGYPAALSRHTALALSGTWLHASLACEVNGSAKVSNTDRKKERITNRSAPAERACLRSCGSEFEVHAGNTVCRSGRNRRTERVEIGKLKPVVER